MCLHISRLLYRYTFVLTFEQGTAFCSPSFCIANRDSIFSILEVSFGSLCIFQNTIMKIIANIGNLTQLPHVTNTILQATTCNILFFFYLIRAAMVFFFKNLQGTSNKMKFLLSNQCTREKITMNSEIYKDS